jgi:6-phosphogluconolactonase/glucosamine-6-phosphate isomerase/deaminase
MKKSPDHFSFAPATFIPFRDTKVVARVRRMTRAQLTRHRNPDFRIQIVPDAEFEFRWITDMFFRIKDAMEAGRKFVAIMPNPWPGYTKLAAMLNRARVDCRRLYTFNMDEYADENGRIAPESWEFGFGHAFKKYFWSELNPKLRPPEKQIHVFTDRNIASYGRMLADLGGADICYSGPGWTGHLAFIEPDAPEFAGSLAEWKKMGPRVCTLSPFTIAQNSLHGCFGSSGDLCAVPPKAATIGPAEVIAAKNRVDLHGITVNGSFASWQRLTTRLVLHGPVTPRLPASILQTLRTDVWVTETAAAPIETRWDLGY